VSKKFNIRVYGILRNDTDQILISDERRHGIEFTKFPGGGLEWGEGFVECLKREFREELHIDIQVNELFYATDFFMQSAFNPNDQLISMYYNVSLIDKNQLNLANINENSLNSKDEYETFHWIHLQDISADTFTFPIDQLVGEKLFKGYGNL
jgi:8-oxo-dGTP diphosphatase